MPIKAILFDLDGTLIDTLDDITCAFNCVLAEYNRDPLTSHQLKPLVSDGSPYMIPAAFDVTVDDEEYHLIRHKILENYQLQADKNSQLYPGIATLLDRLDQDNMPWGIVTNKLENLAKNILIRFNLFARCKVLVGGDTLNCNKPAPEPLWHACDHLKVTPAETLFIGDSERDVKAANAAKIKSITVSHGYRSADFNSKAYDTLMIHDPLQILSML